MPPAQRPGTRRPTGSCDTPNTRRIAGLPLFKHESLTWTFLPRRETPEFARVEILVVLGRVDGVQEKGRIRRDGEPIAEDRSTVFSLPGSKKAKYGA